MKTGHILLKNPIEAIKTPFKDYALPDGSFIGKTHLTIRKGFIVAMHYYLARHLLLETIGEIKYPTESEIIEDIDKYNKISEQKLAITRQAKLAVAILTKNSDLLNANL
jgi:hypothetical protein